MFMELLGIAFYGYAIQTMKWIIKLTKTYEENIDERDDNLDTWLLDRERHVTTNKNP